MTFPPNAALLQFVANPDHAILLLLCGILFLYAEFNKPGTVLLGSFGALLMMFAIYGLTHLPLNPPALLPTLAGIALVALGCRFAFFGLTLVAATACLAFGLANLFLAPRLHGVVAIAAATIFTGVTTWLVRIALAARQNKILVGPQALVGNIATVTAPLTPSGQVEVGGELWAATLLRGGFQPVGAAVIVRSVQERELLVETRPA